MTAIEQWALGRERAHEVTSLIEAWCTRTPEAVAVVDGDADLTYGWLDRTAGGYAGRLRNHDIGPECVVAVVAERSAQYVAMLLGVLRAGAAFLPIEPAVPRGRAAQMGRVAAVRAVLAQPEHEEFARSVAPGAVVVRADGLPRRDAPAAAVRRQAGLAYLIFTSGSTGVPKGAMVTDGGLANHIAAKVGDLRLGPSDAVGFTAPLSFDISVWQALAALTVGARVCVAGPADLAEPAALIAWMRRYRVTVLEIVPSFLALVVDALVENPAARADLNCLRSLISTGEALPGGLAGRWHEYGSGAALINAYGPTECSDDVTHHVVTRAESAALSWPPIGTEILNTRVYVVDNGGQEVPNGEIGALWVGGAAVGRGYASEPVGTAIAFVPDCLSGLPGARLYRTGDRGLRAADGALRFIGRDDRQVKLRGHRIELGDVEAGLLRLPGVTAAACLVDDGSLWGFVTLASRAAQPAAQLLTALREAVPDQLIPHHLTVVDRIPVRPTGKVDYATLAAHRVSHAASRTDGEAGPPSSGGDPELAATCELFTEVLGTGPVGPDDNLFTSGGDSLKAMSLMSIARKRFGAGDASVRDFLATPTPRGLLAVLRTAEPERPANAEPASGALSSGQERLWLVERLHPRRARQLIRQRLTLHGPLDRDALRHGLHAGVMRHETLRMTFYAARGVPAARIWPDATMELEEITGEAPDLIHDEPDLSADTPRPPLMRARLTRIGPDEHRLSLVLHHLIADGMSLGVLARELCEYYKRWSTGNTEIVRPETTFTDYVRAERAWLAGPDAVACERYWADRLASAPPVIDLPWDRPRSETPDFTAGHVSWELDEGATRAVTALARRLQATPFMVVLAALYGVLCDLAGTTDVVVGIDSANRSWPGSEQLVGNFVNQLPLRLVAPDLTRSLPDLVTYVRGECLDAYAHDRLPFHRIVAAVAPPRRLGRFPLFQVKASHQGAWGDGFALPGVEITPKNIAEPATDVDLMLEISGETTRLRLELVYRNELLDLSTAEAWLNAVAQALATGAVETGQTVAAARRRTPMEEVVSAVWCQLLGIATVATGDNFFDVGGHSLAAAQAVYEMADRTGVDLDLETFFELGTVGAVAAEIERRRAAGSSAGPPLAYEGEL